MENETYNFSERKIKRLNRKIAFWKRQFQAESTTKQKIFDWVFGVIMPVICCFFDPIVFKGAMSSRGAMLGEYKPFVYLLSFLSIILLMLFLLYGRKLGWFNALLVGLFTVTATVSLILGIVLTPFSLLGLIFIIGIFGFTPFFSAFVYLRNAIRAFDFADFGIDERLLTNLVIVSAIFSFVLPYVFYANVKNSIREMGGGDINVIRENTKKLTYVSPFINVDILASMNCGRADDESKMEIRKAINELSGMNSNQMSGYCSDW
jgi:hypothetical protein